MSEKKPAQTRRPECLSMTGYAHARGEQNGWAVRVSVKSVNHRFLDLKLRMPEGFDLYDLRLRQIVREHIHRGHLEIHVNAEPGTAAPVQLNKELAQVYLREFFVQLHGRGCSRFRIHVNFEMPAMNVFAHNLPQPQIIEIKSLRHAQFQIQKPVIHALDADAHGPPILLAARMRVTGHR